MIICHNLNSPSLLELKHANGNPVTYAWLKGRKRYGEHKHFSKSGKLISHEYECGKYFRDLLLCPVTDPEEKMLITLKHGGNWLPC